MSACGAVTSILFCVQISITYYLWSLPTFDRLDLFNIRKPLLRNLFALSGVQSRLVASDIYKISLFIFACTQNLYFLFKKSSIVIPK